MAGREPLNEQDFMKMQQDAIERVRAMQARARRTLAENGIPIEPPPGASASDAAAAGTDGANTAAGTNTAGTAGTPPRAAPPTGNAQPAAPARQTPGGHVPYVPPAYARQGHTLRPTLREYPVEPSNNAPPDDPLSEEPLRSEQAAHAEEDPLRALFHLSIDSEQIMLLGILYLLYRDHGDPYLMMALAYLLLG